MPMKSSDDEEVGSHEEGKESNDDSDDGSDKDSDETVKSGTGKDGDEDDDKDDDDDDEEEETAKNDEEDKETGKGGDEVRKSGGQSEEEKETSEEEEGSFDPIPRTPEDSENEIDDKEEQESRLSKEARIQEEEEDEEELYHDVNINQGRGLQVTQSVEDTHVILTLVNPDDPEESSSMSSFVSSMLNPLSDVFSTWMTFGKNTRDLSSFEEETDKTATLHQEPCRIIHSEPGEDIATTKRRCHNIHGDGVRDSAMALRRGQLKVGLEPSTWRRRQDVPRPEGANIVGCMWLFRHKFLVDGTLSRYKARLVADGSMQRFGAYITTVGFTPSHCDSSLFIYKQGDDTAFLLLYVDDIVLTTSSNHLLQQIIASLHREFSMTDLGALNYFLGISVTGDSSGMFLSQDKDGGTLVVDPTLYRSLAGSLQYLTLTRPDITYVIQQAGCPTTRWSTLWYCVFHGHNLLSWSSKRQPTLSRSSVEAEYRGVANSVAKTCWIQNLLHDLHTSLSSATIVYYDN
nr:ribonuclease H-like domain-containing protein [Tanacetum cinerariifolium]